MIKRFRRSNGLTTVTATDFLYTFSAESACFGYRYSTCTAEKAHLSKPSVLDKRSAWYVFWNFKNYAVFFSSNRCLPVLSFWILLWSLFILWAIARTTLWAVTLSMPRYVYRRNAMSAFTSANEPSAWILRFILSCVPYPLVIRSRSSLLFSFIVLET